PVAGGWKPWWAYPCSAAGRPVGIAGEAGPRAFDGCHASTESRFRLPPRRLPVPQFAIRRRTSTRRAIPVGRAAAPLAAGAPFAAGYWPPDGASQAAAAP